MIEAELIDMEASKMKELKKKYNDRYTAKHLEKLSVKHVCEICQGKYAVYNKSHHFASKTHMRQVK